MVILISPGRFRLSARLSPSSLFLPMERPLYSRPRSAAVDSAGVEQGQFDSESTALFEQTYVDPVPLVRSVR